jgi:hypothetical protein
MIVASKVVDSFRSSPECKLQVDKVTKIGALLSHDPVKNDGKNDGMSTRDLIDKNWKALQGWTKKYTDSKLTEEAGFAIKTHPQRKEGFLIKYGNDNWKRRWVILTPDFLAYFTDEFENKPRGLVNLSEIQSSNGIMSECDRSMLPDQKRFCFQLWVKDGSGVKEILFQAANDRDYRRWSDALIDSLQAIETKNKILTGKGKGKKKV